MPNKEYKSKFEVQDLDDESALIHHDVVLMMAENDCDLLSAWRRYKKVRQLSLSKLTGITQSAISRMETKSYRYQRETLIKLSAALGISPAQLIDYE